MKKLLYVLVLCCFPALLCAQWKVVEKSSKKQPVWVGGAERHYLIVSAEAPTLEQAKEQLLINLKQQIIGTVATHVESTTTVERREVVAENQSDYSEIVSSSVRSKLAHIPFISEVSLSKAKDFYWEKLYHKKEKSYKYEYHVRYFFSDFELEELVNDFNAREKRLNNQIELYQQKLQQINSLEEIDEAISGLKVFLAEFDSEDLRYIQVEELSNSFRKLYKYITIQQESEVKQGKAIVGLYLENKPISSIQTPQLLSNCANKLSVSIDNGLYNISYSDENCYEDDDNYIDIRFRFGNQIISKRIYLK